MCDEAKAILLKTQQRFPFDLTEIDITRDARLYAEYKEQIPVIFIEGKKAFKYHIDEEKFIRKLKRF